MITIKGVNVLPWISLAWAIGRNLIRRKTEMDKEIEKIADEVIADVKGSQELVADAKAVKEAIAAESNFFKKLWAGGKALHVLVVKTINRVEEIAGDFKLAGEKKRDLAVAIINKLVDLPFLNESMEATVIGFVIDAIVTAFNRNFGKNWFSKIGA